MSGFGSSGMHLLEIPAEEAEEELTQYLDQYLDSGETFAWPGDFLHFCLLFLQKAMSTH